MNVRILSCVRSEPHIPPIESNPFLVTSVVEMRVPSGTPAPVWTGLRFSLPDDMFLTASSVPGGPLVFGAALYDGELVVFCSAPLGMADYLHSPGRELAVVSIRVASPIKVRFLDDSSENVRKASANSRPLGLFPS